MTPALAAADSDGISSDGDSNSAKVELDRLHAKLNRSEHTAINDGQDWRLDRDELQSRLNRSRTQRLYTCGAVGVRIQCRLLFDLHSAAMPVNLLPENSARVSDAQSGSAGKNSARDHDSKEIPEPANEGAARELIRQQSPRERRNPDESREESNVRREILDCRSAKLVELGENRGLLTGDSGEYSEKKVPSEHARFGSLWAPRLL